LFTGGWKLIAEPVVDFRELGLAGDSFLGVYQTDCTVTVQCEVNVREFLRTVEESLLFIVTGEQEEPVLNRCSTLDAHGQSRMPAIPGAIEVESGRAESSLTVIKIIILPTTCCHGEPRNGLVGVGGRSLNQRVLIGDVSFICCGPISSHTNVQAAAEKHRNKSLRRIEDW